MYQVIIVVHVLLGLGVIGLVLMQQGKGADAGAAFGSASSGSVFGAQGAASFLSRTTAIFATLFFLTSLGLAFLTGNHEAPADIMEAPEISEVPLTEDGSNVNTLPDIKDEAASIAEASKSAAEEVKTIVTDTVNQAEQAVQDAGNELEKAVTQE